MTDYALDYSAGWPQPAAVKAAGYLGAIRYIGFPGRPKCIGQAEYDAFTRAGLGVALVYENQAGDILGGREAGRPAARTALAHATGIGFPVATRPIYYACDTDVVTAAQFAAVLDYLRGAGEVHGGPGRVGVYGEADVIERAAAAGVAAWFWQTKAWSHGIVSDHDHLLQVLGQVTVGGVTCDRNEIHRPDWGQAGANLEVAMPTVDDLWNEPMPWPPPPSPYAALPHASNQYPLRDWVVGARLDAALTAQRLVEVKGQVAALAAAVAAVAAGLGGLADDETKILRGMAAGDAQVIAAVAASNGPVLAALEAAVARVAEESGLPDPADPVAVARLAAAVRLDFAASLARGPEAGGSA